MSASTPILLRLGKATFNAQAQRISHTHLTAHRIAMNVDNSVKIEKLKQQNLPRSFFAYGTLRDDDDSGAPWTSQWTQGCFACYAKVYGFKLYWHGRKVKYPFAIQTNRRSDFIVGRFVTFEDRDMFYRKLVEADKIEDYDDSNPDDEENPFIRRVVDVHITESNQRIREHFFGNTSRRGDPANGDENVHSAIMYFRRDNETILKQCQEVPDGDWLERHRMKPHTFIADIAEAVRSRFE